MKITVVLFPVRSVVNILAFISLGALQILSAVSPSVPVPYCGHTIWVLERYTDSK